MSWSIDDIVPKLTLVFVVFVIFAYFAWGIKVIDTEFGKAALRKKDCQYGCYGSFIQ